MAQRDSCGAHGFLLQPLILAPYAALTRSAPPRSPSGLMNLFARSIGGLLSDWGARRHGMRGRLWVLWSVQSLEAAMCIFMGLMKDSLALTLLACVLFSCCVQGDSDGERARTHGNPASRLRRRQAPAARSLAVIKAHLPRLILLTERIYPKLA